mmetsp:Transcript_33727/g.41522  ORF Transcript_33727/g.41522 Transcript_33727/m.41522 type:complete len:233 (+) Transcript_33727:24-722(+)
MSRKRKLKKGNDEPAFKKRKKNTGKDSHLFTDDNPATTVKGTGFTDENKAKYTLKIMKGRDITYQFQVINTMYYRAKSVLKRTKNVVKQKNIEGAINLFDEWLNEYRNKNRKSEMKNYIKLKDLNKLISLGKYYKVDQQFCHVFDELNGDIKRLRIHNVSSKNISWDIYRNKRINEIISKYKDDNELYCKVNDIEIPSLYHCELIMYGYTPDLSNINSITKNVKKFMEIHND